MSFKLISSTTDTVCFELTKVPLSVANAIRRVCLSEVSTHAIDRESVSFSLEENNVNESSFHDEFLAHRLSFIRLRSNKVDLGDVQIRICSPQDGDLPFVNDSDDIVDFTTRNLTVTQGKADANIIVPHDHVFLNECLLTRLKPGQRLKATMDIKRRAVREADLPSRYNYQPCRVKFYYKYQPSGIEVIDDQLSYDGHELKVPKVICMEVSSFAKGDVLASDIVKDALEVIARKVSDVEKDLTQDEIEDSRISVSEDDQLPQAVKITIRDEDHTLGHLLTQKVREIQEKHLTSNENYAAYQKAHPLQSLLILKIKNDRQMKKTPADVLIEACTSLHADFDGYKKEWTKMVGKSRKNAV